MITRVAFGRHGQCVVRRQTSINNRRCLATAASGSFLYETGDAKGVKFASRDLPGPTTHLAVVAKAGTRYQPLPGFSEGLEKFSFKNTQKRSALRITRETELLGGEYSSYHSRENLVIGAKFLREDLPYFAELIGEVISQTKYTAHELQEEVEPNMNLSRKKLLGDPVEFAINSAHGVAFHRGLGNSLHPSSSTPMTKYLDANRLQQYSRIAYAKSNFAVVANGTNHQELSKWINEFFSELDQSPTPDFPSTGKEPTKYYGGEERIAHNSGNAMVIAFPGSGSATGNSYKPESQVLAALLGGQSNIKWTPGFSLLSKATASYPQAHIATAHHTYSDAGLLTITINGNAHQIRQASQEVVQTIRNVAAGNVTREEVVKAVATAKFKALESGQNMDTGIELTGAGLVQGGKAFQIDELAKSIDTVAEDQVKKAAKALLDGKATVSTVGDLYVLPFAEEMGLHVTAAATNYNVIRGLADGGEPSNSLGAEDGSIYHTTQATRIKEHDNGIRMEGFWLDVRLQVSSWVQSLTNHSYNRYLAVAARVVRRSLKEGERLKAERRGEMELRFAKWENGKQGENKSLAQANASSMAEGAGQGQGQ